MYNLNKDNYINRELAQNGHLDDRQSFYVVAEDIKSGEIISHASVKNMARKRYRLDANLDAKVEA